MKSSNEIRSAIGNIRYYAGQIEELARKQMNEDVALGHELGIDVTAGTKRFDSLGAISSAVSWISTYCDNIITNLEHGEEVDKFLFKPEEEQPL